MLQDDLAIACLMAVELKGRPADQQWLKQRLVLDEGLREIEHRSVHLWQLALY